MKLEAISCILETFQICYVLMGTLALTRPLISLGNVECKMGEDQKGPLGDFAKGICEEFGLWERDPEDVGESRFGDISQTSLGADSRELVLCDWAA